jgi:hypothetical protein
LTIHNGVFGRAFNFGIFRQGSACLLWLKHMQRFAGNPYRYTKMDLEVQTVRPAFTESTIS